MQVGILYRSNVPSNGLDLKDGLVVNTAKISDRSKSYRKAASANVTVLFEQKAHSWPNKALVEIIADRDFSV